MRPKDIGTRMESKIRDVINDWAGEKVCERVALHGSYDHGDLRILVDELVLTGESKHCKEYPSEGMLEDFKAQTTIENANAGQDGVVRYPMSTAYNAGYNPFCTCGNNWNGCCAA